MERPKLSKDVYKYIYDKYLRYDNMSKKHIKSSYMGAILRCEPMYPISIAKILRT